MKPIGEPIQQNQLEVGKYYEIAYTKIDSGVKITYFRYGVVEENSSGVVKLRVKYRGQDEMLTFSDIFRIRPINITFRTNIYTINIDNINPITAIIGDVDSHGNVRVYVNKDLSILHDYTNPNWMKSLTNILEMNVLQINDILPMDINNIIRYATAAAEPNKVRDVHAILYDEKLEDYFGGAKRSKKSTKKKWSRKHKRGV